MNATANSCSAASLHRSAIRRIAVVRALYLGDLLLAVPALRALRARFTRAEITLIGLPWAEAFARRFARYVDRFVTFPGYPGIVEEAYDPRRTARFLAEQRAYGFDLVLQMHGSGRVSNDFALALGGRVTSGYFEHLAAAGLAPAARYPYDAPEVLRNLGLVRLVGGARRDASDASDAMLEFPLLAADHAEAAVLLREIAPGITPSTAIIGMHVGAKAPSRRWPPERFAAVADALADRYGARIVLTGSGDDRAITCAVRGHLRHRALDLSGRTSLGGLAALITRMRLFIGNDSGPAHLAEAVGTPSITIFGPTDPRRWAPLDQTIHRIVQHPVACCPCGYGACPIDHRCLRRIAPEQVLAHAQALLRDLLAAKEVSACGA